MVLAGAGILAYAYFVEPHRIVLERIDLISPLWPKGDDGYKIAFVTDSHVRNQANADRLRRAVEMLLAEQPDLFLFGGDLISHNPKDNAPLIAEAIAPATQCPDGAYTVHGNHDLWAGNRQILIAETAKRGVRTLINEAVPLRSTGGGAWLAGLDTAFGRHCDIHKTVSALPKDAPAILLAHEPDLADIVPDRFVLQLSGHSHAGQICLPGGVPLYSPPLGHRYVSGLLQSKNHKVYVSRGVGTTGAPLRLFCPPEATLITIRSAA